MVPAFAGGLPERVRAMKDRGELTAVKRDEYRRTPTGSGTSRVVTGSQGRTVSRNSAGSLGGCSIVGRGKPDSCWSRAADRWAPARIHNRPFQYTKNWVSARRSLSLVSSEEDSGFIHTCHLVEVSMKVRTAKKVLPLSIRHSICIL